MASGSFPAASILFIPPNSSSEAYWQVTGNQVTDLGYFGLDELGLGLNLLFIKKPALEQSWALINFFDIHQSTSNVLTDFDAPIAPPVLINLVPAADSFRIRVTYQWVSTVGGYGTLAIPIGTFDVLRKKQTEYKSMAVDVKVAPLGWIDISTIGGQQISSVKEMMFTHPNPVHHTLYVHFTHEDAGAIIQLRLINVQGNPVLEQTVETSATEKDVSIPFADLTPGIYTLMLQRNALCVGRARVVKI